MKIMSARPTFYWLACIALAAMAAQGADAVVANEAAGFVLQQGEANALMPVPEPGRALLLFAGMMAMAFTYRRVWLNWKRGS